MEVERTAGEDAFEVDLGAKATTRTSEPLLLLPPFAPAAQTWARNEVLSNICTTRADRLHSSRAWKNDSKVPFCDMNQECYHMMFLRFKLRRQGAPSDVA